MTRAEREASRQRPTARDGTMRGKPAVPEIPRWTKHDPEVPGTSRGERPKSTGQQFYSGNAQAWCYLCSSEHRSGEPCRRRGGFMDTRATCSLCGCRYHKRAPHQNYCTTACYEEARGRRRRAAQP